MVLPRSALLPAALIGTLAIADRAVAREVTLGPSWPSYLGLQIGEEIVVHLVNGATRTVIVSSTASYGNELPGPGGEFCSADLVVDGQLLTVSLFVGDGNVGTPKALSQPVCVDGMLVGVDGVAGRVGVTNDVVLWLADVTVGLLPGGVMPFADADLRIEISDILAGNTFMNYHPYTATDITHQGIDFVLPANTPLVAAYSGTVTFVEVPDMHYDLRFASYDRPEKLVFRYGHQNSITVSVSQVLAAGDPVGLSGGVEDGGVPHLHLEMRDFNIANTMLYTLVNPWPYCWSWLRDARKAAGRIRAAMDAVAPAATGEQVIFSSATSQANTGFDPLSFLWDFGDGQSATEGNPTHRYQAPGLYLVRLTVSDTSGASDSFEQLIAIGPRPAVCPRPPSNLRVAQ